MFVPYFKLRVHGIKTGVKINILSQFGGVLESVCLPSFEQKLCSEQLNLL